MLHDIGKMELPENLLALKKSDMNEDQLNKYKLHPEIGSKIVDNNRLLNNSIKQIVLQHHENFDGTGFPNGLKAAQILTIANIVHLADDFAHMLIEKKKNLPNV